MTAPPDGSPLSSRVARNGPSEADSDPADSTRPVVASAMTIRGLVDWATRLLGEGTFSTPRLDAEVLLSHVLGQSRTWLLTWCDRIVPDEDVQRYHEAVQRRLRREPVAYITGRRQFYGLTLEVTPAVLIPRPETEILVEQALRWLEPLDHHPCRILDLCTGSGAIAVVLAARLNQCRVVATDLSSEALAIAARNAQEHGVADRIDFRQGDLWDVVDPAETFHLVVSNPPYVSEEEYEDLEPNVRNHEPRMALVAPDHGMGLLSRIVARAPRHLLPGAALGLEMGWRQGERVEAEMRTHGFCRVERIPDLAGLERVAWGFEWRAPSPARPLKGRR